MAIALRGLHPAVRNGAEIALEWAAFFRIPIRVTSAFRSWEDQARLRLNFERCVREGRFPSAPDCLFPANVPGDSSHNFGLSFDSVPLNPADMDDWIIIREWVGFFVPPNDKIHGEVPGWRRFATRRVGPLIS